MIWYDETAKFYICSDVTHCGHTHTHTLRLAGWCLGTWGENEDEKGNEDEMGVKMRWKITYPGPEEGNAKEEGRSKHPHQHIWPGAGKPWKGKGKEKRRPTDTEQDQRRGGKTEAPEPTWHSENLRLSRHAQDLEERMK